MSRTNSGRRGSRRDLLDYDSAHERLGSPLSFNLSALTTPEISQNIPHENDDTLYSQNSDDMNNTKVYDNKYGELTGNVLTALEKVIILKPSKTKLKLSVNRVTLTASWKWQDSKDDDDACGICRGAFEACCTNCKMPGDGCPIALGDCKHPFHLHCINKWTDSQPNPSCPLCRTEWKSVVAPAAAAAAARTNSHSPAYPQSPRNLSISPDPVGPAGAANGDAGAGVNNDDGSPDIFGLDGLVESPTFNSPSPVFNPMDQD